MASLIFPHQTVPHDLQDKAFWTANEIGYEKFFVANVAPMFGLPLIINPQKKNSKYAPDLWDVIKKALADLKRRGTPFFKCQILYGFSPHTTVTFNLKDYERYRAHPNMDIYFWAHWLTQTKFGVTAQALSGLWRTPFSKLAEKIEAKQSPLHDYGPRKDDEQGNAKESYLFDLNQMTKLLPLSNYQVLLRQAMRADF